MNLENHNSQMKFNERKKLENYTVRDFVDYFGYKHYYYYEQIYNAQFPKDNVLMRKVKDEFVMAGCGNAEMKKFIDWSFEDKSKHKKTKMTIGLLPHLVVEYMKNNDMENVFDIENKENKEEMNEEIAKWIEEEKKRIKKDFFD